MTVSTSVQLPQSLWLKLERAAALTHRSVQDILVSTVNAALVAPADLPEHLAADLAAMHLMSDQALQAAAQPSLSPAEQMRLGQLNHQAGERSLTCAEAAEQEHLLDAFYVSVLRRAQALAILAQRGHPLPDDSMREDEPG